MDIVARTWWNRENRPYDLAELRLDALVHLVGLVIAITMGSLLVYAAAGPSPRLGPRVWGAAMSGVALKLFAPHRFGRVAIFLYLAIGWSGLVVFRDLARHVPDTALLLLVVGGLAYSVGIIFHLWERLRFQNALWHIAVVIGASLHLWAVAVTMSAK